MNEPQTHTSRPLKWAAATAKWLLGLLAGAWLVFGLTLGAIHAIIVPRIDEWRPELQAWATRAVGIPVRIGQIKANVPRIMPTFELLDVRLLDDQGRDALVLGRVMTSLSVASLWRLELEQVHIDHPDLAIRRRNDGQLEVAGLALASPDAASVGSAALADWLFSQSELVLRGGRVLWQDDLNQRPPVALEQVDLVLRNPGRQHQWRLDATPFGANDQRISLRGDFRSPLLALHPGRWADWSGTAYADLPALDLARAAGSVNLNTLLGMELSAGIGALRTWVDVERGALRSATTDLALTNVHAQLRGAADSLQLPQLRGRVQLDRHAQGWDLRTQGLSFAGANGVTWAQGDVQLSLNEGRRDGETLGKLLVTQIHLPAAQQLAAGLPLPPAQQHLVQALRPQGTVENLALNWTGTPQAWTEYRARGTVHGLSLTAQTPPSAPPNTAPSDLPLGRPGLAGAQVVFDFSQDGGHAQVDLKDGHLVFPGVFEEALIPLTRLNAQVKWTVQAEHIAVSVDGMRFANADLEGRASARWHTSDPLHSSAKSRFPGVLQLSGTLSKGRGDRVHRYLPLVVGADARRYVKEAILGGTARGVQFTVAGDLHDMPFDDPAQGEFRIVAPVKGVDYAFVPPSFSDPGGPRWPVLTQLDGELVFERSSMALRIQQGSVANTAGLKVGAAQARIAQLNHQPVVEVQALLNGPLNDALQVVRHSPLNALTGQALQQATGTGMAQVQFKLAVPLDHTDHSTVNGQLTLGGNDVRVTPEAPVLARARGLVAFNERGFEVTQAQAQVLGGELQFSGGQRNQDGDHTLQFNGQGRASADGLRQVLDSGSAAAVAPHWTGATSYTAQLTLRKGQPEWLIESTLQGLALNLPAPLGKAADEAWALRWSNALVAAEEPPRTSNERTPNPASPMLRDRAHLSLGPQGAPRLSLNWLREVGDAPTRTLAAHWRVGSPNWPAPDPAKQEIAADISWPALDADAWETVLATSLSALKSTPSTPSATPGPAPTPALLPTQVRLDTARLTLAGNDWHDLSALARRRGDNWQAQVKVRETSGQLDYRPGPDGQSGQLLAKLERLSLSSSPGQVGAMPDPGPATKPSSLPALDVTVEALELDGRALGRLELQASNRPPAAEGLPREWRLTRLNLRLPEAELNATGNWAVVGASGNALPPTTSGLRADRRTAMTFKLQVHDSGALLQRLGMAGVFKGGKGVLNGQVGWLGPPHAMNTDTLSGELKLEVASGQFLKADPGLAKLLGVLSLQSLPRRLSLDFSDVFSQGFAFDFIRGDARIEQGVVHTNNLQMKGVTAAVLLEGEADIGSETQDIQVLVVPELNAGTASLIATVINPAVGLGSFLAQAILRQPLIQASTQGFRIHGTWSDPVVEKTSSPTPPGPSAP